MNCSEEVIGSLVVPGSNTPEVLQSAEHALYGIARPI